jgi:hypothetical protein
MTGQLDRDPGKADCDLHNGIFETCSSSGAPHARSGRAVWAKTRELLDARRHHALFEIYDMVEVVGSLHVTLTVTADLDCSCPNWR